MTIRRTDKPETLRDTDPTRQPITLKLSDYGQGWKDGYKAGLLADEIERKRALLERALPSLG